MSERGPAAVEMAVHRQEGFDPAASAGLFVGISTFEDLRFQTVPFAVDDAVDLAHVFALELGLVEPRQCVLALAGEPRKAETGERLARLLERGARRVTARQRDLYSYLSEQAREAGPQGLFLLSVASHGVSDQGGDFLVATDSLGGRTLRTGVAVDELFDEVARARAPRRMVFMDACRERLTAGTRGKGGGAMAPSFADAIGKAKGQVVLAGATLGGFAYDDVKRGNGVFTGAVLDGLRGAASVDERGWITARTLADFVQDQVVEWVRRNREEHVDQSFGIGRRIEGPADSLPLAMVRERSREQRDLRGEVAVAPAPEPPPGPPTRRATASSTPSDGKPFPWRRMAILALAAIGGPAAPLVVVFTRTLPIFEAHAAVLGGLSFLLNVTLIGVVMFWRHSLVRHLFRSRNTGFRESRLLISLLVAALLIGGLFLVLYLQTWARTTEVLRHVLGNLDPLRAATVEQLPWPQLTITYCGFFLLLQCAFSIIALREYGQAVLGLSEKTLLDPDTQHPRAEESGNAEK